MTPSRSTPSAATPPDAVLGPDATAPSTPSCPHTPPCPSASSVDAGAARIVSEHLQDCGYALLCNGVVLLEGEGLLLPVPRGRDGSLVQSPPG